MRIIAGSAKGRRLKGPKGRHIRPVLDQVKEAVFNILFDVEGLKVLDIFAGTGSIGLEAVSRGAATAVFIENNREAIQIVKENIGLCGFEDRCRLIPKHVGSGLKILQKKNEVFDLVFIDPPYLKNLVNPALTHVLAGKLLNSGGKIIIEHHPKEAITKLPAVFTIDERRYGQTLISFISKGHL